MEVGNFLKHKSGLKLELKRYAMELLWMRERWSWEMTENKDPELGILLKMRFG